MRGATPPLLQYVFMALYLVKNRGQFYPTFTLVAWDKARTFWVQSEFKVPRLNLGPHTDPHSPPRQILGQSSFQVIVALHTA